MHDRRDVPAPRPPAGPPRPRRIHSRELLSGARTVTIIHGEEHYQLRLTKTNRLILTK